MGASHVGRITDRSTFVALRRPTGRAGRGPIRVSYLAGASGPYAQVGYAIGRRCGNAVTRNRIRRRLREAARVRSAELAPGAYLVAADPATATLPYAELVALLSGAMRAASRGRSGTLTEAPR